MPITYSEWPVRRDPSLCDLDDRPAVARIRWTAWGGAPKYARVCEYHRSCTEGWRGVDVLERYQPESTACCPKRQGG